MSENNNRNPYTGMNMVPSNSNGEVIKVEDLINKPQKNWEQYTPLDTLENADSELTNLYDNLSKFNSKEGEVIKVEDFMNMNHESNTESTSDLRLNNDELINNLTEVLRM